jgi:prepilin-type N-terminal cleavage/methylation domain-containing protein
MSSLNRRGFTLIELLVGMVLLGIVSAAIYRVLVNNQRIYQAQTQRVDLQQNIRAATQVLPAELRELDAFDGDILAMGPDSIRLRAMRQFGVMCTVPQLNGGAVTGKTLVLRNELLFTMRAFQAGDSVLVYNEGNESVRTDDGFAVGRVTGAPTTVNCGTADARAGTQLTVDFVAFAAPIVNVANAIPLGGPVHGFEIVTYKLYQAADGLWYLGLRNSGGLQPLVGPLTGSAGLRFNYYDGAGAVTAVPANVAQIEIIVRGRTAQPVPQTNGGLIIPVDSVTTRVALRNNRRWN